jgi:hypothetical protein
MLIGPNGGRITAGAKALLEEFLTVITPPSVI